MRRDSVRACKRNAPEYDFSPQFSALEFSNSSIVIELLLKQQAWVDDLNLPHTSNDFGIDMELNMDQHLDHGYGMDLSLPPSAHNSWPGTPRLSNCQRL
ncbi:hypothetical protein TNIN_27421 [Trichonephila inaurata madagascariensis]|uniref:Uncharacterized protein n=1 Tax=Trichonephila inaurata madagascariensis TaxID=2747483 RepID=A0A8X7BXA2_9ARAC|nr:hypothetical protein TNIN_27421 [Trichonephila inaurata madagascariensis]